MHRAMERFAQRDRYKRCAHCRGANEVKFSFEQMPPIAAQQVVCTSPLAMIRGPGGSGLAARRSHSLAPACLRALTIYSHDSAVSAPRCR